MNTIKLFFGEDDTVGTFDSTAPVVEIPKFQYEVLSPLFKRGHLYEIGDIIELDEQTAQGFIELNEIKEINNGTE